MEQFYWNRKSNFEGIKIDNRDGVVESSSLPNTLVLELVL